MRPAAARLLALTRLVAPRQVVPPTMARVARLTRALTAGHSTAPSQPRKRPAKAACLIIGNEVLTGKVQDTNTQALAKLLWSCGVDLVRVEVVPDEIPVISDSLRRLRDVVGADARALGDAEAPPGFVFTSGGIGPTHDDVTYDAVAATFGVKLELHQPTLDEMEVHFRRRRAQLKPDEAPPPPGVSVVNADARRMALLPAGAELVPTPGLWVPLVVLRDVYVLPGIPALFSRMIESVRPRLEAAGVPAFRGEIRTDMTESQLASALRAVAERYPDVAIGSYPKVRPEQDYTTLLTFDGRDLDNLRAAIRLSSEHIEGRVTMP